VSICIAAVNIAIDQEDERHLLRCLVETGTHLYGVLPQYAKTYVRQMQVAKAMKERQGLLSFFASYDFSDNIFHAMLILN